MQVALFDSHSKKYIGGLELSIVPRNNEWVEYDHKAYSIHRVLHSESGIKLLVIPVG